MTFFCLRKIIYILFSKHLLFQFCGSLQVKNKILGKYLQNKVLGRFILPIPFMMFQIVLSRTKYKKKMYLFYIQSTFQLFFSNISENFNHFVTEKIVVLHLEGGRFLLRTSDKSRFFKFNI